jgi:hypothetical protein
MKGWIILFFIAATASLQAQNLPVHSLSLRLGAPVGITFKTYTGKRESFELGIGGASPFWNNTYYVNSFNNYSRFKDFKYIDHRVSNTIYLQGRYLKDFSIPTTGMEGSLNWYCGVGAVVKIAKVNYRYTDITAVPPTQTYEVTDFDIGPEAILGAEYWLEDTPFSFYGEGSAMLEIVNRVGGRLFAGVGVRYHFLP